MSDIKAGPYVATVKHHKVGAQKDGTPKVSVCWDIGQKDGIWQDLILKDSATKFLNWQLDILGITSDVNLVNMDLSIRAESINKAIAKAVGPKFNIEVSYRDYLGKSYSSVTIKSKIENLAPVAETKPVGGVDTSEPLPF